MALLLITDIGAQEHTRWLQALREALPHEEVFDARVAHPREAIDVAVVAQPPAGALAGLPALKFIQSLWAGVERLLADATLPAGVPLARMVDPAMTTAMAETAHWAVLGAHRGFFRYAEQQRRSVWHELPPRRADEVSVGLLGLGALGRAVAHRLVRCGYRVMGLGRTAQALDGVEVHTGDAGLRTVLERADVVVNLLPLTPATRGLFNRERLAWLRREATLVNLARGAHVVDADLLAALDAGALRHAVLDVFNTEPLPAGHPYWQHPRVTVLPHMAGPTDVRSAAAVVAANVQALRQGRPPQHLVQRERGY